MNKIQKLQKSFIERSIIKHNNKFDYSKVKYVNAKEKVIIGCPIHGDFLQTPNKHLNQGCNKCSGKNKSLDDILKEFRLKHGDRYDYSKVEYVHPTKPMTVICKEHGEFITSYRKHLYQKRQCKKCSTINSNTLTNNDILSQFMLTHGDRYDYSKVEYVNKQENVIIGCPIHGDFLQRPDNHSNGKGCPRCASSVSYIEKEIRYFIESLNLDIITNSRQIIAPQELDIFIPSKNIAIEFNGLFWHSEKNKGKNYHLNKTIECQKRDIQLIHIFEDEWLSSKDIVKSRLMNILGLTSKRIYARKCIIKTVQTIDATQFLKDNHIQGVSSSKIKLGLYYNDELVSLMTFGNLRNVVGLKHTDGSYELLRFCHKKNISVIGGASKLLQYFIKSYKPSKIISYADRRWSTGQLYQSIGFQFASNSKPNYSYIINRTRKHRYLFRKNILVKQGFDKSLTERQIMNNRGIDRIYDCGVSKWILILN